MTRADRVGLPWRYNEIADRIWNRGRKMIRQIICKDVMDNVLGLRFVLSLFLTTALFAASAFVFTGRYAKQSQEYWRQMNDNLAVLREASGQLHGLAFCRQRVVRKPKTLMFCTRGFEQSLPDSVGFNVFTSELPQTVGQSNFVLPHCSDIDWVFIISMILSLAALVFTYDSICGEREQGTLRFMLVGAIPRHKVLLGKYCAAMGTLAIPLCIGLLINLIIVVSSKGVVVSPGEWSKILTLVFLSFLYLSVFVLLGLFVSCRTAHPTKGMVILLLVWVALGILVPSFGRIVSDVSSPSLTHGEFQRKLDEAESQVREKSNEFGPKALYVRPDLKDPQNNPPARARLRAALTNARNHVIEDHHHRMLAQVSFGWNLACACVSPVVVYQRACEAIAGTGISHCVNLRRQIRQYREDLFQYIRDEDSKDPNSVHLVFDEMFCAEHWKTISHEPVDFNTVPKFVERDLPLGASLKAASWGIGLLTVFNLLFFAACFVSFLRYDVR
jgi:ABC-type transport system involved in multi-copper enzyme maturation permease subunit